MILVDTSVWVAHFRFDNAGFAELLERQAVLTHPFVIGELACGNLKNRTRVLGDLEALTAVTIAEHRMVLHMIDVHRLWAKGIGWIDSHLLASALITRCALWTLDKRLACAAAQLGIPAA